MFEDVYKDVTAEGREQMKELKEVLDGYEDEYDLSEFEGGKESL